MFPNTLFLIIPYKFFVLDILRYVNSRIHRGEDNTFVSISEKVKNVCLVLFTIILRQKFSSQYLGTKITNASRSSPFKAATLRPVGTNHGDGSSWAQTYFVIGCICHFMHTFYNGQDTYSLCGSVCKEVVHHVCGHEFESRLKWKLCLHHIWLLLSDSRGMAQWFGAHYNQEVRFMDTNNDDGSSWAQTYFVIGCICHFMQTFYYGHDTYCLCGSVCKDFVYHPSGHVMSSIPDWSEIYLIFHIIYDPCYKWL